MDNEEKILFDVFMSINNTFSQPERNIEKSNPVVEKLMSEKFIPGIVAYLENSKSVNGITFPVIKSAFSYFFTKTVDSVFILNEEGALVFGTNVLFSSDDIMHGTCGVSEYFSKYGINPNNEYSIGEQYFYSFQDICAKYQKEIEESYPLISKMILSALFAMIALGIQRGNEIKRKKKSAFDKLLQLLKISKN